VTRSLSSSMQQLAAVCSSVASKSRPFAGQRLFSILIRQASSQHEILVRLIELLTQQHSLRGVSMLRCQFVLQTIVDDFEEIVKDFLQWRDHATVSQSADS